jgi:hypothetical protein
MASRALPFMTIALESLNLFAANRADPAKEKQNLERIIESTEKLFI